MELKEQILSLCKKNFIEKGLDIKYEERLNKEIKELDEQNAFEYLLDLREKCLKENLMLEYNQRNLFVSYLLDLTNEVDLEKPPDYIQGEYPDIDCDYLPIIQPYIKNEWAPKVFGENNVCSISTYQTLGIKQALQDVVRAYGLDRNEIVAITTSMHDKDDENNVLTWEKALEIYPEFAAYCQAHPEIARDTKSFLNKNRNRGKHAGGLIISSKRLDDFVPLEVAKDGTPISAWTEGLHNQDLQPVGLIKFDILVITNNLQVAHACRLIKERYSLKNICSKEDINRDWSDTSYLNDPEALAMANTGDLRGIFQFDSEGIRSMVRRGGVTCFDDLVAYSSLYRPGPMRTKMHERFIERKRGREDFEIFEVLKPVLGHTWGVMVYQEQVMKILNIVGKIPLKDCEAVRKAISKKKVEKFIKYQEMFLENGQKVLGISKEEVQVFWDQIVAFAEYGFNKSVTKGTLIPTVQGLKKIEDFLPGDVVLCVNENGETVETEVVALHDHGYLEGFEITFDDGYQIICSANHKFLTEKGQISIQEICKTGSYIMADHYIGELYGKFKERWVENSLWNYCKDKQRNVLTSERMSRLFEDWMGEKGFSQISLWNGVQNLEKEGRTFKELQDLRSNQKKEHQIKNGKIKQRQSISIEEKNIFRNGPQNFNSSRSFASKGRQSQKMEDRKSREVCQVYRSTMENSQGIQNGILVKKPNSLGFQENSLWQGSETSRFCEEKCLDRSGWVLSFFRTQEQFKKAMQIAKSPSQRQDVERRVYQKKECDAFKVEHGMFSFLDGSNETGSMELGTGHASITDTRNLVHRKIVRVRSVGRCHMFDLEVANLTHNFILPNGMITSNSHSCAYTYLSSRLLFLKSHYPLEFYAAILMCESNEDKIKEYKTDASRHKVIVEQIDLNKSKETFSICEDKIYYGFSHIKGIGEEVANRIVKGQPYVSFEDFLNKFGTDASVLKPLICLGVFDQFNPDRVKMYRYYECYKEWKVKKDNRNKRVQNSIEKQQGMLEELLKDRIDLARFDEECYEAWKQFDKDQEIYLGEEEIIDLEYLVKKYKVKRMELRSMLEQDVIPLEDIKYIKRPRYKKFNLYHELCKVKKKRERTLDDLNYKVGREDIVSPKIDTFVEKDWYVESELLSLLRNKEKAELQFYGFLWLHPLETSPDYHGSLTIENLLQESEMEGLKNGPIEVMICDVESKVSKNDVPYCTITVQDVNSQEIKVVMWSDDYQRFKPDLVKGNLVRMRVVPPNNGFRSLTFYAPSKRDRKRLIPERREDDLRLLLLKKPLIKAEAELDLDSFRIED